VLLRDVREPFKMKGKVVGIAEKIKFRKNLMRRELFYGFLTEIKF
jgi:hypothetical protein